MNKRGAVVFYLFMLALVIIITGLALAPMGKQITDNAMNQMDCSGTNHTLTTFDKVNCVAVDANLPLIFGGFILIGIAILSARLFS